MEVLREVLEERKRSAQVLGVGRGMEEARHHGDFLDHIIEEITKAKAIVTDKMALDLMFVLLFASFHTTSLALTFALRLLADHPHVLEELTVSNMLCLIYALVTDVFAT
jgi:cytochrome P450